MGERLGPLLEEHGCSTDPSLLRQLGEFCDIDHNGRVNYFELVNGLTWEDSLPELRQDLLESINATIYFHMDLIRCAFQCIDFDHRGCIQPADFATALETVHEVLNTARANSGAALTASQISALVAHLPREAGGCINYERFLRSFRIVDTLAR